MRSTTWQSTHTLPQAAHRAWAATSPATWLVWLVPWNAALVALDITIGGRSVTGLLWTALVPACAVAYLLELRWVPTARVAFPCLPWLVWACWVWLSNLWSDNFGARSIQDAIQITMPIGMAIFSSRVIRSTGQLRAFLRSMFRSGACVVVIAVLGRAGVLAKFGIHTDDRSLALYSVLVGAASLALYPPHAVRALWGWGLLVVPSLVTGSRMATAVHLMLPFFHPRVRWFPAKLIVGTVVGAMGIAIFYSAPFQQRFFGEAGRGSLSQLLRGEFLSFGRFETWPYIWSEAWNRPWIGHGVGSCARFVPTVWLNMTHPHNDYLRVFFEFGGVGFVMLGVVLLWQAAHLARVLPCSEGLARVAVVATILGFCGFLLTSMTDNTFVYNAAYMNPLFALMGAAYGVGYHETRRRRPRDDE